MYLLHLLRVRSGIDGSVVQNKLPVNYSFIIASDVKHLVMFETPVFGNIFLKLALTYLTAILTYVSSGYLL